MSLAWQEAIEALRPLRVRAKQLQVQAEHEHEASVQRWKQSERPVLKEHASGLKDILEVLLQEEASLKEKISSMNTNDLPNHPGTTTGFNIIRARTDAQGQPLSTDALRAEKQRLMKALDAMELGIAEAKAEITAHNRRNEEEIWETKLVALQDTKRVYRDEINLIEVELLGREHYERIERERQQAEASGTAQLRRLQEQILQTRIKLNRAKTQYYFPQLSGYNITFGGGGIYGACKDICISEINGCLKLTAEPGERKPDGTIIRPARMIVTFQAATEASQSPTKEASPARKTSAGQNSNKGAEINGLRSASAPNASAMYTTNSSRMTSGTTTPERPGTTPEKTGLAKGLERMSMNGSKQAAVRRSVTFTEGTQSNGGGAAGPSNDKEGKGFASKFIQRIGKKKDKFQGRQQSHLQPAVDQDITASDKSKRSLARKLLSRKFSKQTDRPDSRNLQQLAFDNKLTSVEEYAPEESIDDSASLTSSTATEGLQDPDGPSSKDRSFYKEGLDDGDGSLASSDDDEDDDVLGADALPSPLTKEALQNVEFKEYGSAVGSIFGGSSSGRGSWLRNGPTSGNGIDAMSQLDDGSSVLDFFEAMVETADEDLGGCKGVFVTGRLKGFDLVGERGTKVPNLTIGEADVRATVFVRFVFEYTPETGWGPGTQPGDRPRFHVENLAYKIRGNNVPMPPTLIKHILRVAIPGLIQRKLLALMPKEFGDYVLNSECGFDLTADVGCVGPSLSVLDADLGFEVKGPARSSGEARKQQQRYEAAKKARALLGLSLPQAQILAEIFNGGAALLDPPRPVSIVELITIKAKYERHPVVYKQLCQIIDTAYNLIAQGHHIQDFSFHSFMAGPLAALRQKPARARVIVRDIKVDLNVDAIITAIHDFTQRTIEEMVIKGPLTDPKTSLDAMRGTVNEELQLLHAWHAFVLRELQHFKSKYRGSAATLLAAADKWGFSAGMENCFYEGPLRLRMPVAMQLDQDGAFSFEVPLPSPEGKLGVFMDNFKALTVPSHLRPPAQAVNWIEITGDPEIDARMQEQVARAISLIDDVVSELGRKIEENNLAEDDADPEKVLSRPRTTVGDRLGRFIVNRLKVRVRLDERRIGEILSGLDSASMGDAAYTSAAGRIIGHLGDVMTLAFTPAAAEVEAGDSSAPQPCSDRYLFQMESSDVSRLRADVQSLGFQSAITPGGMVRLVHAVGRAALFAFKEQSPEELDAYRTRLEGWYRELTRDALDMSVCIDVKGTTNHTSSGAFIVSLSGTADDAHLRATSPLLLTNELDLVPLGRAMAKQPPPELPEAQQAKQR